jgi:hypothetical protein
MTDTFSWPRHEHAAAGPAPVPVICRGSPGGYRDDADADRRAVRRESVRAVRTGSPVQTQLLTGVIDVAQKSLRTAMPRGTSYTTWQDFIYAFGRLRSSEPWSHRCLRLQPDVEGVCPRRGVVFQDIGNACLKT